MLNLKGSMPRELSCVRPALRQPDHDLFDKQGIEELCHQQDFSVNTELLNIRLSHSKDTFPTFDPQFDLPSTTVQLKGFFGIFPPKIRA